MAWRLARVAGRFEAQFAAQRAALHRAVGHDADIYLAAPPADEVPTNVPVTELAQLLVALGSVECAEVRVLADYVCRSNVCSNVAPADVIPLLDTLTHARSAVDGDAIAMYCRYALLPAINRLGASGAADEKETTGGGLAPSEVVRVVTLLSKYLRGKDLSTMRRFDPVTASHSRVMQQLSSAMERVLPVTPTADLFEFVDVVARAATHAKVIVQVLTELETRASMKSEANSADDHVDCGDDAARSDNPQMMSESEFRHYILAVVAPSVGWASLKAVVSERRRAAASSSSSDSTHPSTPSHLHVRMMSMAKQQLNAMKQTDSDDPKRCRTELSDMARAACALDMLPLLTTILLAASTDLALPTTRPLWLPAAVDHLLLASAAASNPFVLAPRLLPAAVERCADNPYGTDHQRCLSSVMVCAGDFAMSRARRAGDDHQLILHDGRPLPSQQAEITACFNKLFGTSRQGVLLRDCLGAVGRSGTSPETLFRAHRGLCVFAHVRELDGLGSAVLERFASVLRPRRFLGMKNYDSAGRLALLLRCGNSPFECADFDTTLDTALASVMLTKTRVSDQSVISRSLIAVRHRRLSDDTARLLLKRQEMIENVQHFPRALLVVALQLLLDHRIVYKGFVFAALERLQDDVPRMGASELAVVATAALRYGYEREELEEALQARMAELAATELPALPREAWVTCGPALRTAMV